MYILLFRHKTQSIKIFPFSLIFLPILLRAPLKCQFLKTSVTKLHKTIENLMYTAHNLYEQILHVFYECRMKAKIPQQVEKENLG